MAETDILSLAFNEDPNPTLDTLREEHPLTTTRGSTRTS